MSKYHYEQILVVPYADDAPSRVVWAVYDARDKEVASCPSERKAKMVTAALNALPAKRPAKKKRGAKK